jgi:transposase-like protein
MFEQAIFQSDEAAREHLETNRWPEGAVCPHCGCIGNSVKVNARRRAGLWKCNDCHKQFTVTVGTVFERSHIPLHKWYQAVYLLAASKKGMSSHQMHRMLGVTYKTAWFMTHRIREAMRDGTLAQMGGRGQVVEVDETYWGNIPGMPKRHAWHHKEKIVSLVERGGDVRSFHVEKINGANLRPMLVGHIAQQSHIMTDEAGYYNWLSTYFADHSTVHHKAHEYSRGGVTTNTIEGFFSILKRGLIGTYHHVGGNHLEAYLDEFDFRYNTRDKTDMERTMLAMRGISGKRLTYHPC